MSTLSSSMHSSRVVSGKQPRPPKSRSSIASSRRSTRHGKRPSGSAVSHSLRQDQQEIRIVDDSGVDVTPRSLMKPTRRLTVEDVKTRPKFLHAPSTLTKSRLTTATATQLETLTLPQFSTLKSASVASLMSSITSEASDLDDIESNASGLEQEQEGELDESSAGPKQLQLSDEELNSLVHIRLDETDTMFFFDMPSTWVDPEDEDEVARVQELNSHYEDMMHRHKNMADAFCAREAQTDVLLLKTKEQQTVTVTTATTACQSSQADIYDTMKRVEKRMDTLKGNSKLSQLARKAMKSKRDEAGYTVYDVSDDAPEKTQLGFGISIERPNKLPAPTPSHEAQWKAVCEDPSLMQHLSLMDCIIQHDELSAEQALYRHTTSELLEQLQAERWYAQNALNQSELESEGTGENGMLHGLGGVDGWDNDAERGDDGRSVKSSRATTRQGTASAATHATGPDRGLSGTSRPISRAVSETSSKVASQVSTRAASAMKLETDGATKDGDGTALAGVIEEEDTETADMGVGVGVGTGEMAPPHNVLSPEYVRLWKYTSTVTENARVTCMVWSEQDTGILAVGYSVGSDPAIEVPGLVCCWSIKSPTFPQRVFRTHSSISSLCFSKAHPQLLVAGLYDGNVVMFDALESKTLLASMTNDSVSRHAQPVRNMNFVLFPPKSSADQPQEKLVTCATDGRVLQWQTSKGLVPSCVMEVKRVAAEGSKTTHSNSKTAFIARQAGAMSIDFTRDDPTMYLLGTEDGPIHLCSTSYADSYLASFFGHTGTVYRVRHHPHHHSLFLSCSADWTVRLWSSSKPKIGAILRPTNAEVRDIVWSPVFPLVFASISQGKVHVWDLEQRAQDPILTIVVESEEETREMPLVCVEFNSNGSTVLVGDESGATHVLLIPQLALRSPPTQDEITEAGVALTRMLQPLDTPGLVQSDAA
eukprot:m.304058 g.304058  ORF g.304058 m.304058 type:complete len:934 (-) comp15894_c0_seq26:30-2831(-)